MKKLNIEKLITGYANAKTQEIQNNELMRAEAKEEKIERIERVLQMKERGSLTTDEAMEAIATT